MKKYDAIVIGTGSAMIIVQGILRMNPDARIAVIDKDTPGGICLTRGCIPSKMVISVAEIIADAEKAGELGVDVEVRSVDFRRIMERMRKKIGKEVKQIEEALKLHPNIDFYNDIASFVKPYTLKVGGIRIKSDRIFIGSGSRPLIPPVKGLEEAGYLTSDTFLKLEEMPESMVVIGGGYIAVEYGNFLARAGCDVKIVEMMPRILVNEEPEVTMAVQSELSRHAEIYTSHRVVEVEKRGDRKAVIAVDAEGNRKEIEAQEILVAVGRESNSDLLKPENGGIEVDEKGWIKVNEYLETSSKGVYAIGDANGRYMFRHVANQEAIVAFENAFRGRKIAMDYSCVPHAVFTQPEVASVGMREEEAIKKFGKENVLVGYEEMKTTGKGLALNLDGFAKVIVHKNGEILGAHIVGKCASILIQEVATLMALKAKYHAIFEGYHIHPALSEVVAWAYGNLMSVDSYHRMIGL